MRTDATLAKQDLIAAREAKALIETEKDRLVSARESLRADLVSLEQKILAATTEISALQHERSAYAQSTKSLAYSRYYVMAKHELATMRKVAEICASYGEHRKWLATRREFAKLEKQWEALPFAQQYDEKLPINKRMNVLREDKSEYYKMWFGVPTPPSLVPSNDHIALTAHSAKLLNGMRDHEEFNSYAVSWLLDQISIPRGARAQTGEAFVSQTKKYAFLDQLLPKEREEFSSQIDNFLRTNERFRALQINVTVASEGASPDDIIAAGKKTLPDIREFQQAVLVHLHTIGIAEARTGEK